MSPTLAGGFFTTEPPGKSRLPLLYQFLLVYPSGNILCRHKKKHHLSFTEMVVGIHTVQHAADTCLVSAD